MSDIVRIDPHAVLPPDPDHPGQRLIVPFHGSDPTLEAGIWAADESAHDIEFYPVDEVCVVLAGTITITTTGGKRSATNAALWTVSARLSRSGPSPPRSDR